MRRGFTLVEVLVALGLAAVVSASILMLARGQLLATEMNEQVLRAQANTRAGIDYLENVMRRACGGLSQGAVGVNVAGAAQEVVGCVRVFDGPTTFTGASFVSGDAESRADAMELIYPVSQPTVMLGGDLSSCAPQIDVADAAGLSANDLVLVSDNRNGLLLKIDHVEAGRLVFAALPAAVVKPSALAIAPGLFVFRAASIGLFVSTTAPFADMLMLDPDGVAGSSHDDADPLVDGVIDLQIAVGRDDDGSGTITDNPDEWLGHLAHQLPIPDPPWNTTGRPQLRSLRATVLTRTSSLYAGAATTIAGYENRSGGYPTVKAANARYRPDKVIVSPRAWNLAN
jgi:prepilin-type N-terminal cleavage/methylation domain-containing protein